MTLNPLAELPATPTPKHLTRVPNPNKRRRLVNARGFWRLGKPLDAETKA